MDLCRHTGWLRLSKRDAAYEIEVSDRADRLLGGLTQSDRLPTNFTVMIGNRVKALTLQRLGVTHTSVGGRRGHGEVHLCAPPLGRQAGRPLVVADADMPLHNRIGRRKTPSSCHEASAYCFSPFYYTQRYANTLEAVDHVYHRLLLPFADMVCIFADDIGGTGKVAQRVAAWLDMGRPSTSISRPWLVIVVDDGAEEQVLASFRESLRTMTSVDISQSFESVRIVSLAGKMGKTRFSQKLVGPAAYSRLERELALMLKNTCMQRELCSSLFSAWHLNCFLHYAAATLGHVTAVPFDFVRASRNANPVAGDLDMHIQNFLSAFNTTVDIQRVAIPMLASSLLLDHYPPGMHRKLSFGVSFNYSH